MARADTDDWGETALLAWIDSSLASLREEVGGRLDIEGGLADALLPEAHGRLVFDLASHTDLEEGLIQVLESRVIDGNPAGASADLLGEQISGPPELAAQDAVSGEPPKEVAPKEEGRVEPIDESLLESADVDVPRRGPDAILDLTDGDASGKSFHKQDLRGSIFAYAALVETDFSGARLDDADFTGANLLRANLRSAVLVGARLTSANLAGCDLRYADLRLAKFDVDDLEGATWDKTTLWSPGVSITLQDSSVEVAPGVFEVSARPEEAGAGARRRR